MFIKVVDGRMASLHDGVKPKDKGDYRDVPDSFAGLAGMRLEEFNADWSVRPLQKRLDEGLIDNGKYYKAIGEDLVPKSQPERIRDGLEQAPTGMKVKEFADGSLALVPMTIEERYSAGLISKAVADDLFAIEVRRARDTKIEAVEWRLSRYERQEKRGSGTTESPETYAALLAYVQALRDVPAQEGFPMIVTWPTEVK